MPEEERILIGKTTATYQVASTVDEFYFWIKEGVEIQPYDFVTARDGNFYSIGTVVEISNYTDAMSHLSNRIVSDVPGMPLLDRLSATVAKVSVFYSYQLINGEKLEKRYPVSSGADVFVSNKEEILDGLNAGQVPTQWFPAGIISRTSGDPVIVPLQAEYLVGPESGHMNVSGISGLATKTSYMMFLLYCITKKSPDKYINIIFNVKSADLMNIDKKSNELDETDKSIYKLILKEYGVDFEEDSPEPFTNVKYYQPRGPEGKPLSYSTRQGDIYAFTLSDVHNDLDLLLSDVRDEYHTVDSFTRFVVRDWNEDNDRWEIKGNYQRYKGQQVQVELNASTWKELRELFDYNADDISGVYGLAASTVGRIKREIGRLTQSSIFVENRGTREHFIREVIRNSKPGQTIVIDIAKLERSEQTFVIGEVFRELGNIINLETEENHKQAIVVVDELNTLAPAKQQSPLKEQIIEVARKGRSVGFIIFGAEQFASEVDDQIIGNSALRVLGRTSAMEISSPAYSNYSRQEKNTVMMLRKGEMLISYPVFRSNVKIRFPRPPYKTQSNR